jgi:hypothetical protein
MKIHLSTLISCGFAFAICLGGGSAYADTLLIQRVKQERGMQLPTRGMSMAQVEREFGAPASKLSPEGGDAPRHPVINRWTYANFTVYFEHTHVIDSVVNRVSADEIGPKGAVSNQ